MAGRKQERRRSQQNRAAHDPAEQEQRRRQDRQRQGSEYTALSETDCPNDAVGSHQSGIHDQIRCQCTVRPETEACTGNVKDHQAKAPESADLLRCLKELAALLVFKPILAFDCKNNIRDHDHRDINKTVKIKPTHFSFSSRQTFL